MGIDLNEFQALDLWHRAIVSSVQIAANGVVAKRLSEPAAAYGAGVVPVPESFEACDYTGHQPVERARHGAAQD